MSAPRIGTELPMTPDGLDVDPIARQLNNPQYSPSIEECIYWAAIEREHEYGTTALNSGKENGLFAQIFPTKNSGSTAAAAWNSGDKNSSKEKVDVASAASGNVEVSMAEREQAYRAFRTAGWISVFYLITTDILGPYSAPWAFSQLGI